MSSITAFWFKRVSRQFNYCILIQENKSSIQLLHFDIREWAVNSITAFWFKRINRQFNYCILIQENEPSIQLLHFDTREWAVNSNFRLKSSLQTSHLNSLVTVWISKWIMKLYHFLKLFISSVQLKGLSQYEIKYLMSSKTLP